MYAPCFTWVGSLFNNRLVYKYVDLSLIPITHLKKNYKLSVEADDRKYKFGCCGHSAVVKRHKSHKMNKFAE